jgi:hypothetical protein
MYTVELLRGAGHVDSTKLRGQLNRIHSIAADTLRVIDTVKRLNSDSQLERVDIDLSALCSQITNRLAVGAPNLRIRIQSDMHVEGDTDQVEVLLDNLISNALKFSSHCESPQICITATDESNRVIIHVADNGIGIAPEDAERIFLPFTRCHSSFPGTGVGLTTARRIVEQHGGRIWASGEPGLGTTISFYL